MKTPSPMISPATKPLHIIEERSRKNKKKTKKKKSVDNMTEDNEDETENKPKADPIMKDLIAEYFMVITEIGKGAFGQIFLSYNLRDKIEVAIKKELKRPQKFPQLKTEAKVYQSLLSIAPSQDINGSKILGQDEDVQGVPHFYGMGELFDCYYLIMEFLGPNLIDLFNFCQMKKLTLSTVCLIALQIINRIENIHKHHYLHRDIKPENFLIGNEEKTNIIFLVDFGLSKRYKNSKNHQHIPYKEGRTLIGTARYVSINTHLGIEQSRRDDLESIGYVLIFFLKGNLPWQGLKIGNDKYARIMEKKLQIPTEILCYGLPDEITHYLNYVKSLRFEDRPDYDYLRSLFIKLLGTCTNLYGLTKEYLRFDWCFDDPKNSIWLLYSRNKKTKKDTSVIGKDSLYANERISKNLVTDNSNSNIKKEKSRNLSLIEEGQNSKDVKTNENNNALSYSVNDSFNSSSQIKKSSKSKSQNSNTSRSRSSQKEKKSLKEDNASYQNSEDTVKVAFNGVDNTEAIQSQLTDAQLKTIFNGTYVEEIDGYINKLIQKRKKSRNEKTNGSVIGAKTKGLKDSLDIVPAELKSNRSHLDSPERKRKAINNVSKKFDEDDEGEPNQELVRNTMRNSKIITSEEMEKLRNINTNSNKKTNSNSNNNKKESKFVTTIHKNLDQLDNVTKTNKKHQSDAKVSKSNKNNMSSNSDDSRDKCKTPCPRNEAERKQKEKEDNQLNNTLSFNNSGKGERQIPSSNRLNNTNNPTPGGVNVIPSNRTTSRLQVNTDQGSKAKEVSGRSFEAEIIPKISNPEIKERRKSKILEISSLPQMQNVKLSKEALVRLSNERLSDHYVILGEIGNGSYGKVKRVKHKKLGEERAMKIINKKSESAQNEVDILRKVSHPNIINVFEIFEDSKKFYIMSELLEGGELFEAISEIGVFSEADACRVMRQILNAVNYLHSKKIVHRDLKPENIMLTSKISHKNKFEVKIIDFGTAKAFEPHQKLNKFIGTSYYIAPEVLKECYDEKCDVWSCGVVMYILLCGYPPFNGNSNVDIYHNIQNNPPYFSGEEWKEITKEGIDLLKAMLNKVSTKRYSAEMCLNHKWFKLLDEEEKGADNQKAAKHFKKTQIRVISKMAEFVKENKFKQAVLQFISTQFNLKKEEEDLRELFKQFDKEKKGQITKDVFYVKLCELYGENDGKEICDNIFGHLDLDGSGEISYDEFLTAMIDGKKIITGDRLEKAFKMFDKDGNGKLSVDEIISVFGGDEMTWKKVIEEVDLNKDGEVDFDEFKLMMNNFDNKLVKKR